MYPQDLNQIRRCGKLGKIQPVSQCRPRHSSRHCLSCSYAYVITVDYGLIISSFQRACRLVRSQVGPDSGRSHANLLRVGGQSVIARVQLASSAATAPGDSLGEDLDDELKKRLSPVCPIIAGSETSRQRLCGLMASSGVPKDAYRRQEARKHCSRAERIVRMSYLLMSYCCDSAISF